LQDLAIGWPRRIAQEHIMRAHFTLTLGLLLACSLAGCNKDKAAGGAVIPGGGDEAAAKAFLEMFLKPGADRAALSKPLAPTKADCEAVFDGAIAAKAFDAYSKAFASGKGVIDPGEGRTQLLLFSATTDDLKAANEKAKTFPGGYKDIAGKLKGGLTFYRWKYVKPGETLGMAYDGLVYVNGHWAWFPKPWRFLRGA
jgi:hypothetical protein